MNKQQLTTFIDTTWDESIVPALVEFVKIPNKSPAFDAQWQEHGYMEQAVQLISNWCTQQALRGFHLEIIRLPNRTPLIFMEIDANDSNKDAPNNTVLLYGHLDKQPEMTGWSEGLGPWTPVIRNNRLYGRGGADDGYAAFASVTAIKALQEQQIPHARCVILIEACEESGSTDLPYYIDALQTRIGQPDFVICLDSMCGNYEQLWMTTSLRGLVSGELRIDVLSEGVHSGQGSGVVPSSFRVLRQLLDKIENETNGEILLSDLHVTIPVQRQEQAKVAANVLGPQLINDYPFHGKTKPVTLALDELILNKTWRPALSITGVAGIPTLENAGNVLRPYTSVMLSMRIPPHCDADQAANALKKALEENPPYDASVQFTPSKASAGWDAPALAPWLEKAAATASEIFFGAEPVYIGEGGSIPFMGMLGKKFPQAQFMITGVLGPHSNAHGPNEFLDIPMGKKLTACVSHVLQEHVKK